MLEPDDFPPGEIVAEIYCHVILWTKKLRPALTPEMLAKACEAMDQAMYKVDGEALAAGGTENHLHILARMSPHHPVQAGLDALRHELTAMTAGASGGSPRGRGRPGGAKDSAWSREEVAVTLSPQELKTAKKFIESQASHHDLVTFQTELKAIFDEHGFDYDEQTLFG